MHRTVHVHRLGTIGYGEAHTLQKRLQEARSRKLVPDTLLLLEHPPVITLGRGAKEQNLRFPRASLVARGIEVHDTGRGGDVTYHGPGQLVGYPILDLSPDRQDVRRYVRDLEESMIRLVARWGLMATRIEGMNGTWLTDGGLGDRKIGAIGVRLSRWVTMHGFAINVSTLLSHFSLIVPCGIVDKGVTSLELELGRVIPIDEVIAAYLPIFAELFACDLVEDSGHPLDSLSPEALAEIDDVLAAAAENEAARAAERTAELRP
jgi:lipoyl(octanoyl) transferase